MDSVIPKSNRSSPVSPSVQVESNQSPRDDNSGGFKRLKIEEDTPEDGTSGSDNGNKGAFRPWKPDTHVTATAQNGICLVSDEAPENGLSEHDQPCQNHIGEYSLAI